MTPRGTSHLPAPYDPRQPPSWAGEWRPYRDQQGSSASQPQYSSSSTSQAGPHQSEIVLDAPQWPSDPSQPSAYPSQAGPHGSENILHAPRWTSQSPQASGYPPQAGSHGSEIVLHAPKWAPPPTQQSLLQPHSSPYEHQQIPTYGSSSSAQQQQQTDPAGQGAQNIPALDFDKERKKMNDIERDWLDGYSASETARRRNISLGTCRALFNTLATDHPDKKPIRKAAAEARGKTDGGRVI